MSTVTGSRESLAIQSLPSRVEYATTLRTIDGPCQMCGAARVERLLDLGPAPLLVDAGDGGSPEGVSLHPLQLGRCGQCGVLQTADVLSAEERHAVATAVAERAFAGRPESARRFCEDAIDRWQLSGDGHIIEIGSGTGSLLRFFRAWQLPVLGIEPDLRLTRYARLRRIPTWRATFDAAVAGRIARAGMQADLLIISTPTGAFDDLHEIFAAASTVLRPGGVATLEIPDVLRVVGRTRFDDLCHANRVIPSLAQLQRAVSAFGMDVIDVERAELADDRLRVWIRSRHQAAGAMSTAGGAGGSHAAGVHPRLRTRLRAEAAAAIEYPHTVAAFVRRTLLIRDQIISLVRDARRQQRVVAVYGTSPEAVAVANAVRLRRPDVAYVIDRDPSRCGGTLPGTNVPVISPEEARSWRADLLLALDSPPTMPGGWEDVPVYAVMDLIDVVHRILVPELAGSLRC